MTSEVMDLLRSGGHVLLRPTAFGMGWIVLQGITVLVLAELQWMGLRGARRQSGIAAA